MNVSYRITEKNRFLLLSGIFSVVLLTPVDILSSTGQLGNTSSATMKISLIIHPKLETKIPPKIALSSPAETLSTTSLNTVIPLCINGNGLAHYSVTAKGHLDTGDFALTNGDSSLPYSVLLWKNISSAPQTLNSGQPSQNLQPLNKSASCKGSPRLALQADQLPDPSQPLYGAINLTLSAH
ncbi:MAG: hypothetical protein QS721_01050 [Candidatus Endonucleobacter sp. (ex Gigantidas childressi)]|nr:hypothetical protein [Candidatus Endonucleobacter sp. (ex Gigantidas childressi)]